MSLEQLYIDFNVQIAPQGHKHNRSGWVNTTCPYCVGQASPGYHLGFNIKGSYFTCYHCGGLPLYKTISLLINLPYDQVKDLTKKYNIKSIPFGKQETPKINIFPFKMPSSISKLNKGHRAYLKSRGYDPDYLEKEFGVMGTGPISKLDNVVYKFRIIAPILWDNKIVSFQSRDYTGKQELRYITCPMNREIIHHKHILYGKNLSDYTRRNKGIIVEGIFDVWRFKEHAAGTFGIGYTRQQVRIIKKIFKEVFIIFDPDINAQRKAKQLIEELLFFGVHASNILLDKDPGEMSQKEADKLLQKLKFI